MTEEWRSVPGSGVVEASSLGRIRFRPRKVPWSYGLKGWRLIGVRYPKGWLEKNGYRRIMMPDGRKELLHRLVCLAWHGLPPEDKPDALHGPDHDPSNCRPENLRWGSHAENMADKVAADRHVKGEAVKAGVLTEKNARAIKFYSGQLNNKQLAGLYGVTPQTIGQIRLGKRWAWLKETK